LRFAATLLTTFILAAILVAMPCLADEGTEPLLTPTVLHLPLICNDRPPVVPPDGLPVLVAPGDGTALGTIAPELVWRASGDHWYGIDIATDPEFATKAAEISPCAYYGGPEFKTPLLSNLDPSTLYYWRVGYRDDAGLYVWSPTWAFQTTEVAHALPPAPVLTLPEDGATASSLRPRLAWQPVPGVTMYHVTFALAGNGFSHTLLTYLPDAMAPFSLLPGRVYEWRVRTRNSYGWGPESATYTFTAPSN